MAAEGMVEELEDYFAAEGKGEEAAERHPGLGKAIGVPEFRECFVKGTATAAEALAAIKENTRRLAAAQVRKIRRLGELGWDLLRVDATATVRARMRGAAKEQEDAWQRDVVGPSLEAIERFLEEDEERENEEEREKGRHQLLQPLAVSS